jgi:hypothetical protein
MYPAPPVTRTLTNRLQQEEQLAQGSPAPREPGLAAPAKAVHQRSQPHLLALPQAAGELVDRQGQALLQGNA